MDSLKNIIERFVLRREKFFQLADVNFDGPRVHNTMIEWFKENWFWFFLFFGGGLLSFLQSANPLTLAIVCATILACWYLGKFLEIQERKLLLEQKRLELEQRKVDAIMELDNLSSNEKWQRLELEE